MNGVLSADPGRTVIHSVRILGAADEADWILFEDGRVRELGRGDSWRQHEADAIIDARETAGPGALLTPGFIDLHGHGGGGHAHEGGRDAILAARAFHLQHGTTRAVVSFATAPIHQLASHVATVAELVGRAGILGSHLEGPFLAPERKGAHDAALLCAPEPSLIDTLLQAGDGTVRQVTIAPELAGGIDAVRRIVDAGAVCAVGHTNADRDTAARAFDAGASLLTHVFNAMPGLLHRSPGPIGAALSNPDVTLEIIVDDTHVHADLVRTVAAAAPTRTAFVTDAMVAAGMPDGEYLLGALDVTVRDGVARLTEGDAIAGSTLTQDDALRRAVRAGVPLEVAVNALTRIPAAALAEENLGKLSVGSIADAVLLDADLAVRAVWVDGKRSVGRQMPTQ